jgi:hypothetical protein
MCATGKGMRKVGRADIRRRKKGVKEMQQQIC